MDDILKDERFKHIAKDSRFKEMRKKERKFKVDTRFKNMFSDDKFKLKYSVDKRGRPVNLTSNDNLKKFYELSSSDNDSDNDESQKKEKTEEQDLEEDEDKKIETSSSSEIENVVESDKSNETTDAETSDESDDESDSEDSLDDEEKEELEIAWNELDKDTVREEKISSRLACCNMDWDRIKASDLFVLLNSFKPPDGVIKSVKVYISEFGKERIAYEKLHGPAELNDNRLQSRKINGIEANNSNEEDEYNDDHDSDDDDNNGDEELGSNFNRFKLRQYQFNRLKYYYAVIECDNATTANKIYTECDGNEYESSCTRLDLRFVPDDTEFNEEDVTQSCLEAPDPLAYKPNLFVTTALNQTKVECTWDETPRERLAITMKNYTEDELKKSNFNGILAMSSEEEDEGEHEEVTKEEIKIKETEKLSLKSKDEDFSKKSNKKGAKNTKDSEKIRQYRELLFNSSSKSEKKREGDLEFSWEGGMEEEGFNSLLFDSKKKNENKSKKFDKKIELTNEEIKEEAQLSLMAMDMEENNKAHFNLDELIKDQPKKSKKKSRKGRDDETNDGKKVDDFKVNVNDPRFEALFVDHNFNIDPSNQLFKKTDAMETLVHEKLKRKLDDKKVDAIDDEKTIAKSNADVSLMIRSIKSKTEVHKKIKNDNKFSKIKKIE